mmetsp:Transcript_12706/g.28188  ORF Transcript_12706/g.28188 Transcript_12706/m.28188 type:complete len:215 (-) Transcript_12706:522-1166(-)
MHASSIIRQKPGGICGKPLRYTIPPSVTLHRILPGISRKVAEQSHHNGTSKKPNTKITKIARSYKNSRLRRSRNVRRAASDSGYHEKHFPCTASSKIQAALCTLFILLSLSCSGPVSAAITSASSRSLRFSASSRFTSQPISKTSFTNRSLSRSAWVAFSGASYKFSSDLCSCSDSPCLSSSPCSSCSSCFLSFAFCRNMISYTLACSAAADRV